MGASCDPISSESIIICAAGSVMQEDGVAAEREREEEREGCNLCLIPLILESLLIRGSSFHHLANPEVCHSALQGSVIGCACVFVWSGVIGRQTTSGGNTHTHCSSICLHSSQEKKDMNRKRSKYWTSHHTSCSFLYFFLNKSSHQTDYKKNRAKV